MDSECSVGQWNVQTPRQDWTRSINRQPAVSQGGEGINGLHWASEVRTHGQQRVDDDEWVVRRNTLARVRPP